MAQEACEKGASLIYPLADVLRNEARMLHYAEYSRIDWEAMADAGILTPDGTAYRAAVGEALLPLSADAADVRLLALLDVAAGPSGDVTVNLSTASPSAVYDYFLIVLERRALPGQAAAMRRAQAAFEPWEGTPESRRLQWTDGVGNITGPGVLQVLKETSTAFLHATPSVMDRALSIIAANPDLAARYGEMRRTAGDDARFSYLMGRLWACVNHDWWTPDEAEAALAVLPRPQRDLVVLDIYIAEAMNGAVHQFFYNSSGTLAPELAEILDRHGLAGHAGSIREGMGRYATPYPVHTNARREEMQGFSEDDDTALYDLTVWADDGEVIALMHRIAKEAGLWPKASDL